MSGWLVILLCAGWGALGLNVGYRIGLRDAYRSQAEARTYRPVRIYHCTLCDRWHLTSQAARP